MNPYEHKRIESKKCCEVWLVHDKQFKKGLCACPCHKEQENKCCEKWSGGDICPSCGKPLPQQENKTNDLLPFEHGQEGTHAVCNKHNIGGKSTCCECNKRTDCSCHSPQQEEECYYPNCNVCGNQPLPQQPVEESLVPEYMRHREQARADLLNEIIEIVEEMKKEELAAKPADDLEKTAEWYKISALNDLKAKLLEHKQ